MKAQHAADGLHLKTKSSQQKELALKISMQWVN